MMSSRLLAAMTSSRPARARTPCAAATEPTSSTAAGARTSSTAMRDETFSSAVPARTASSVGRTRTRPATDSVVVAFVHEPQALEGEPRVAIGDGLALVDDRLGERAGHHDGDVGRVWSELGDEAANDAVDAAREAVDDA